ncbi:cytolysin and hemolysin HlyA pore-forming toxin [Vibrio maritimus]|uniref:Cytolysin and hemolysin HlyA pore-forming toxin n=1 Tax=Vibrio maritimus TaxID=990268 RepID=A0A090SVT5_9VIBR|nr:cytolysin and hemolysin HlyA pore-forming toxin [Vibrio maritimus]
MRYFTIFVATVGILYIPGSIAGVQSLLESHVEDKTSYIVSKLNDSALRHQTQETSGNISSNVINTSLDQDTVYIIDATAISRSKRSKIYSENIGVGFNTDLVIVGRKNGLISFSPINTELNTQSSEDNAKELFAIIEQTREDLVSSNLYNFQPRTFNNYASSNEHVESFFIHIRQGFQCNVPVNQYNWIDKNMCPPAVIDLNYKVSKFASQPFDSNSPEQRVKYLIVELEEDASGAGIKLNNDLYFKHVGWDETYSKDLYRYSAFANRYAFEVNLTGPNHGNSLSIKSTIPSNENGSYEQTITTKQGYTFNALRIAKDPTSILSFNSERGSRQKFDIYDFNIRRNNDHLKSRVDFVRGAYSNHCDLLKAKQYGWQCWFTDTMFRGHQEAYDIHKLQGSPIGWLNFSPNARTQYMLTKEVPIGTEPTKVSVSSIVGWTGLRSNSRFDVFNFTYTPSEIPGFIGPFYGEAANHFEFTVDWNDPIFLGTQTVNIRSLDKNNSCLEVGSNNEISVQACDSFNKQQSFIFSSYENYRSATNVNLCLGSSNQKLTLVNCTESLNLKWQWPNQGETLTTREVDSSAPSVLAIDTLTNLPVVITAQDASDSNRYTKRFTTEFTRPWHSQ